MLYNDNVVDSVLLHTLCQSSTLLFLWSTLWCGKYGSADKEALDQKLYPHPLICLQNWGRRWSCRDAWLRHFRLHLRTDLVNGATKRNAERDESVRQAQRKNGKNRHISIVQEEIIDSNDFISSSSFCCFLKRRVPPREKTTCILCFWCVPWRGVAKQSPASVKPLL